MPKVCPDTVTLHSFVSRDRTRSAFHPFSSTLYSFSQVEGMINSLPHRRALLLEVWSPDPICRLKTLYIRHALGHRQPKSSQVNTKKKAICKSICDTPKIKQKHKCRIRYAGGWECCSTRGRRLTPSNCGACSSGAPGLGPIVPLFTQIITPENIEDVVYFAPFLLPL